MEGNLGRFEAFTAEIRSRGRKPKVYLSGAGALEKQNLPAFMQAQEFFESLGYQVLNPAVEQQRVIDRFDAASWAGMGGEDRMRTMVEMRDRMVREADMVVGLESGVFGARRSWRESEGATLERKWALDQGKPFHAATHRSAQALRQMATTARQEARFGSSRTRALPRGVQGGHQKAAVRYWLDLETQGLRTQSRSKVPGIPARRATDRLRLSQISFGREVKPGMLDFIYGSGDIKGTEAGRSQKVFTDIITEELLKRYQVTDPENLPDEFLKHLTQQDMKGYWDVGVFVEGNPLREGLKRHVAHVLGGRQTRAESKVVEGMIDRMLEDVHHGKQVTLSGWNVGFDWSRVEEVSAANPAVSRKLRQLMQHQRFQIQEAADPIFEMTWNLMMHDREFVPRFTDRAKLERLVKENKNVRGAIVEHQSMRSFMDIVGIEDQTTRFSRFQERFRSHLRYGESDEMADELADMMTKTRTFGDFRDVVRKLKSHEDRYVALRQLFDRSFKPTEGKHVSLLGIAGRDESIVTTGFNFTLGWRQEQVAQALAEISDNPSDQKMLKELLEAGLHDSDIDVMVSSRIGQILRDISAAGPNDSRFQELVKATLANEDAMAAGFMEDIQAERELRRILGAAQLGPEDMNLNMARNWFDRMGIKGRGPVLAGAAVALGGLWLLGEHNRSDEQIEGIRRPVSEWDQMYGINPTGVGSDFGSGRNVLAQLMGENYFSKAPSILTTSREHIWEMTSLANALKPSSPTMRAVEEGAVKSREMRQALIDQTHLADNELSDPWRKLAQQVQLGREMPEMAEETAQSIGFTPGQYQDMSESFFPSYMSYRRNDHRDLAEMAIEEVVHSRDISRARWANNYRAAQEVGPVPDRHRPINLVNDIPRRQPADTKLVAGHAGYVQNLGRMARRSHIRDPYHRLGPANPMLDQFRRYRPRQSAARGSRMEACATC